jgi:hypothetical protein
MMTRTELESNAGDAPEGNVPTYQWTYTLTTLSGSVQEFNESALEAFCREHGLAWNERVRKAGIEKIFDLAGHAWLYRLGAAGEMTAYGRVTRNL